MSRRMYSEKQIKAFIENSSVEVVKALKGKDINVNGITSKGIANTGNIANIGDIAATGKITGGEIIENMSGYSFTKNANLSANGFTLTYVGAAKTGNKITFALAGELTPTSDTESNPELGRFEIPSDILAKIIPDSLGFSGSGVIPFVSGLNSYVNKLMVVQKPQPTSLAFRFFAIKDSLTLGTTYSFRIEQTFLLSENLVAEE